MHFDIMNEGNAFENARRTFENEQQFYQPEVEIYQRDSSKLSVLDEELLNLDQFNGRLNKEKSKVKTGKNIN